MAIDTDRIASGLDAALRAAGSAERAIQEKRYLKSELAHYGTSVPGIRRAANAVRKAHPELGRTGVVELVKKLWAAPVHERRMAAVELLDIYRERLEPGDLALVERLLREARTWALVDGLSVIVAGALVERHPSLTRTLDRWASDPDFWVRRAAMLALLKPLRDGRGTFDRFARYADAMLEEKEFFIRKAIGWVLRETSRKRPDLVYAWLAPRVGRASGVTLREALKYLPPPQQRALRSGRSAARRRRPQAP